MIEFFLRRPIFASVCSAIILLAGIVSIPTLPIAQFPKIAPPVVTVTATYTGASAQAVESSVTTPLEEAINGVQGLRYMSSESGNDGSMTITCTFELDRDLDQAATDVQNAVNTALARLPPEVTQTGVTVSKNAGNFVMAMGLSSHDPKTTALFISNYADLYIKDDLKRVKGVSDVIIFGERKYAMRLWLNPKELADNGLDSDDVVAALQDQNVQVAAGTIGQPPISGDQPYQLSVRAQGRLSTPDEFANLILKTTPDGGFVRLRDVGRVDLGAEDYSQDLHFDGRQAVGLGILALPTSNALDVSKGVRAELARLSAKFPNGIYYKIAFDATEFVNESIREVFITLLIAIALVVLVIYLFLQDWRTTLIPAITIPISLIGTFGLMKVLGFSINTLTLFGLTLATGLVVDDAIVIIENIARFIQEKKMPPLAGAAAAMREISGAVVATSLVLLAVFVPVAFFPGTTGQLYKQFALTIACSVTISLFNALTLTPTLSALLLGRTERPHGGVFDLINRAIARMRKVYHDSIPRLIALRWPIMGCFVAALVATGFLFTHTPTGFTPDEDQGYFIVTVQAPEGVSLDYTERVTRGIEKQLAQNPDVLDIFDVNGFGFTGNGPNHATMFIRLKPWAQRPGFAHSVTALIYGLYPVFGRNPDAQIFAFNPPSIQGVGNFGGFQYELQDTGNVGLDTLTRTAYTYMAVANRNPNLSQVYTTFRNDSPQLVVDLDRQKAKSLGIPLSTIFDTMQVDLGSLYVNDFDYLNRAYRVYVQADTPYRSRIGDLQNIYVRASSGNIIPLTELLTTHIEKSAPVIYHYNLFRSIELSGQPAPGHGSGDAIAAMEQISKQIDPPGVSHEWSGISLDEIESGSLSALIFGLGILVVYMVLAAQYESLADPFIILMAVPLAIFGALAAVWIRDFAAMVFPGIGFVLSDVYAQVGFVMLIGLASKNAILIVEFANQLRAQGLSAVDAARQAAETRLRPILMTSFAFILGIAPLVFATGAGSASRHSLGTPVFGGMIVSTFLNLIVVPVLYVIVVNFFERDKAPRGSGRIGHLGSEPAEREAPSTALI
ncbi:MAG TPA: multidrug efflux RND transporter permease subunit [Candidatus Acidoferrales bacterium]|nr:multidrug efflux RND transporter permease subunit [Candidatus Acidoferrales bacterium]